MVIHYSTSLSLSLYIYIYIYIYISPLIICCFSIIIIIIIIIYSLELFFTSAIADGLSQEFEWQQVSSSLQNSLYSGRSQLGSSLNGLHMSAKSSSSFSNTLVTVSNAPITIGIIVTFMFHRFFFSIPLQVRGTYPSFHLLSGLFCGLPGQLSR